MFELQAGRRACTPLTWSLFFHHHQLPAAEQFNDQSIYRLEVTDHQHQQYITIVHLQSTANILLRAFVCRCGVVYRAALWLCLDVFEGCEDIGGEDVALFDSTRAPDSF